MARPMPCRSLLALTCLATGCAATASPRPPRADATAELLAITRDLYRAIPMGDRATWDRHLAPDFVLVDRDGAIVRRAAVLADLNPIPPSIQLDLALDEIEPRVLGDAAVIVFRVRETETIFGQTLHVDYRTNLTFARRAGRWQLVLFQYVEVPRDGAPVALRPDQLDAYVGRYAADADHAFTVTRRGDRLFGARTGKPEVELIPEADGAFYVPGTEFRKLFVRDAGGAVVEMLDRRKGTDVRWRRVTAGAARRP